MGFWDLLKSLIIMIAVIFAAYYVTKFIAKTGGSGRRNDRIKVLSSLRLGKDSSVVMVEIENTVYILGVGNQHVELIDKLTSQQLSSGYEEPDKPDFAAIFKKELSERFKRLK